MGRTLPATPDSPQTIAGHWSLKASTDGGRWTPEVGSVSSGSTDSSAIGRWLGQAGQLLNVAQAAERAGLSRAVGLGYVQLPEAVFLVRRLAAWGRTLNSRANASPKVHVVDSGVGGWLLGLGSARLTHRDPAALQQYGHLLESFAVHEILKQVGWLDELPQAGHFRTKDGLEADLVLELFDGRVAAVEVKAGTVVRAEDCRGLAALRDRLGPLFIGGVVLHTGELACQLADRLFAVPIDQLWTLPEGPARCR